jgi:ArsR family transcriptional regulator
MDELVTIAATLGDPLRLKVLDLLSEGRRTLCCSPEHPDTPVWVCACDISKELGLAPSKLAYHLSLLRASSLVREQRRGKWVYYAINEEVIARFTHTLSSRWAGRMEPAG